LCGLAGIVFPPDAHVPAHALHAMDRALRHRGPDDSGIATVTHDGTIQFIDGDQELTPSSAVFSHRRLSILDLSAAARQPMISPDGRYALLFNGAIYNYVELREQLRREGWAFKSDGDTEVLLAALTHWGKTALHSLNGMFALAFVDTRERQLLLARDRFGIKPLYLMRWREGIAFASEIKALLALTNAPRRANARQVYEYLQTGATDTCERTMFHDVCQLPPSGSAEINLTTAAWPNVMRYWRVDQVEPSDLSFDEAASSLRERFLESIELHMRSDVNVGSCLSGGLDSSAIVAAMREIGGPELKICAFTHVAEDQAINELHYARCTADHAHCDLHTIEIKAEELVEDLSSLIESQDEPFRSTSVYAQRRVFQRAHAHGVKVMLDGQGADELLAGYEPYLAARLGTLLANGKFNHAMRLARAAVRTHHVSWRWLLMRTAPFIMPQSFQRLMRFIQYRLEPQWLDQQWVKKHNLSRELRLFSTTGSRLHAELTRDLCFNSVPSLLRYEDRNSMTSAIESRVPFLSQPLVELLCSLPEAYLINQDGQQKAVFREAMRPLVPERILTRQDKIGFATPQRHWLRALTPQIEAALRSDTAHRAPLNLPVCWSRLKQMSSQNHAPDETTWRWINLILWADHFDVVFD